MTPANPKTHPTDAPQQGDTPQQRNTPQSSAAMPKSDTLQPSSTPEQRNAPKPENTPKRGDDPKPGNAPETVHDPKPGARSRSRNTPRRENAPKPGEASNQGEAPKQGEAPRSEASVKPAPPKSAAPKERTPKESRSNEGASKDGTTKESAAKESGTQQAAAKEGAAPQKRGSAPKSNAATKGGESSPKTASQKPDARKASTTTPKPAVTTQKASATAPKPAVTTPKASATAPKPAGTGQKSTAATAPKPAAPSQKSAAVSGTAATSAKPAAAPGATPSGRGRAARRGRASRRGHGAKGAAAAATATSTTASQRLLSLDTLRGFDMLFIMGFAGLVAGLCRLWPGAFSDWLAAQMGHATWDGFFHHDTIFPLFLFIAGVSFPFSLAKQRTRGLTEKRITAKIIRRGLTLVLLGLVYNGLFQLHFDTLRIPSVLGRIGLAWMFAALIYTHAGCRLRIAAAVGLLALYSLVLQYVPAPDAPGAGPLTLEGNIVGYVDRSIMPAHLYLDGFDPEGLLSTLPAIVTALLGMFTGAYVRRGGIGANGARKALVMAAGAVLLAVAATLWNLWQPVNKSLWNGAFVCAAGAYSLGLFALFYYLIDVRQWRRWTFFFKVIGVNSITIYLGQQIISFTHTSKFFFGGLTGLFPPEAGAVVLSAGYIACCWLLLWFLDRQRIYLKV